MRAVSLVPSITESLFELGLGHSVVAITDYCIYPAEALAGLPRIGGTKNPRLPEIVALQPDVVFANQEENTRAAVEGLRAAGVNVVLHFPQTVEQAVADLASIAALFGSPAARQRVAQLAQQVAAVRQQAPRALRTFVPVWYEEGDPQWWMTLNQHTFTHDVLALCGFENVFAARERRYPLAADLGSEPAKLAEGRDTRYPRVTAAEIRAAQPQAALLPSEPYAFAAQDAQRLADAVGGPLVAQRIRLVDGSLLTWPGTRLGLAISALQALHADLMSQPVSK
ncbi:MAG: ABC transporter substrate-binding protein [Anaerolineales bacterium]|nr:MAG: ABC transporter substrate-binding protein [Anaerolineales bacterium]